LTRVKRAEIRANWMARLLDRAG